MQMKLCIKMSDDKSWLVLTSSHISPSGACVARLAFLQAKTGSKQRKQAKLTSLTRTSTTPAQQTEQRWRIGPFQWRVGSPIMAVTADHFMVDDLHYFSRETDRRREAGGRGPLR